MMSMLPGFNSDLLPKGNDKQSQMMIRRYITIIESMTDKEMDSTNIKILQEPSRINRLARGSGSSPQQVGGGGGGEGAVPWGGGARAGRGTRTGTRDRGALGDMRVVGMCMCSRSFVNVPCTNSHHQQLNRCTWITIWPLEPFASLPAAVSHMVAPTPQSQPGK